MKNLKRLFTVVALSTVAVANANPSLYPDEENTMDKIHWVVDEEQSSELPRNFRMASDPYKTNESNPPTRKGLDNLRASASAQFSEETFKRAIPLFQGSFIVVDLRQETHGFLNGIPISNYIFQNRVNQGKTSAEIHHLENHLLGGIHQLQQQVIYNIVKEAGGYASFSNPQTLKVMRAETEQQLIERLGGGYQRLHVLDHHPAKLDQVDEFVTFIKGLQPDTWVHFHCRGGRGRATTFMAFYDIIRNGKDVSLDEIVRRQHLIGGKLLTRYVNDPHKAWRMQPSIDRHVLLRQFYAYVNDAQGYSQQSFQSWLKTAPAEVLATCNGQDGEIHC